MLDLVIQVTLLTAHSQMLVLSGDVDASTFEHVAAQGECVERVDTYLSGPQM